MILVDACTDIDFIVRILAKLLKLIHFVIPIILIVMLIIDISKVVITNPDDKVRSETFSKAIKRVIYAVIIFLVPTILFFVMDRISGLNISGSHSDVSATNWYTCFKDAYDQ